MALEVKSDSSGQSTGTTSPSKTEIFRGGNSAKGSAATSRVCPAPGMLASSGSSFTSTELASANILTTAKTYTTNNFPAPALQAPVLQMGNASGSSTSGPPATSTPEIKWPAGVVEDLKASPTEKSEAQNLVAKIASDVQRGADPLQVLSDNCKKASSPTVKKLVLAETSKIKPILTGLVGSLTTTSPGESPAHAAENIFFRFKMVAVTIDYDPAVKRALLSEAFESNNSLIDRAFNRPEFVDLVRASLPKEEQSSFADFVKSSSALKPETRLALQAQIIHYPGQPVIENLTLLAGQDWFRGFELGQQQWLAKVFAFDTQYIGGISPETKKYKVGDREILDNTLAFFLRPQKFKVQVEFADLGLKTLGQTFSKDDGSYFLIKLSRDWVMTGNGKLNTEDKFNTVDNGAVFLLWRISLTKSITRQIGNTILWASYAGDMSVTRPDSVQDLANGDPSKSVLQYRKLRMSF
jgi:hypothetical protein